MICWFWNNNCVIDYPSWFQAVGSVLAIFVAIGIAYWQHHVSEKNGKAVIARRREAQMQVGHYFAKHITFILENCIAADYKKDIHLIKLQGPKIDDLLVWSRIFVIDTFDYVEMHGFLEIRDSAFELRSWVETAHYDMYHRCENSLNVYQRLIPWLDLFGVKAIDISKYTD